MERRKVLVQIQKGFIWNHVAYMVHNTEVQRTLYFAFKALKSWLWREIFGTASKIAFNGMLTVLGYFMSKGSRSA